MEVRKCRRRADGPPAHRGTCEVPTSPQRGLEEAASTGDLSPAHSAAAQSGSSGARAPASRVKASVQAGLHQECGLGASLEVQWSRPRLPMQGVSV